METKKRIRDPQGWSLSGPRPLAPSSQNWGRVKSGGTQIGTGCIPWFPSMAGAAGRAHPCAGSRASSRSTASNSFSSAAAGRGGLRRSRATKRTGAASRVKKTETERRPMTAIASGRCSAAPAPSPSASGNKVNARRLDALQRRLGRLAHIFRGQAEPLRPRRAHLQHRLRAAVDDDPRRGEVRKNSDRQVL